MGLFDKFKKKKTKKESLSDFNQERDKNRNAFDNFNKSITSSNRNANSDTDSLNDNKLNFEFLENFINSNENSIVLKGNILLDANEESKYQNGIDIKSDNLVIDGNGYFIDARGKTRIFQINGNNITFKNIHFKNGFSDKGGSILNNGDSLKIEDCIFESNNAKNEGGVIYNTGDSLKVFNSIFKDNGSKWHGGVIYNIADNLQIEICKFLNNSVNGNASVIYNKKSSCNIADSKFNKNISQGHGGVIYNNGGEISIRDSCFRDNNSRKNAGVIFNLDKGIICENTKFINNSSKSHGGAIYNDSGQFIASNSCIFENNVSHRHGGSIFNNESSSVKLNEAVVRSNHSKKSGGAIYNKSSLIINNSAFFKNSTAGEGGAIYNESGFVESYNSNFVDNSAEKFAYAIFNNNFLKIADSIIIDSNLVDTNNTNNSIIYMESGEDNKLNLENTSFFIKSLEDKNVIFINGGYSFLKNNKFYFDSYGDDFYPVYNENGELNLTKFKFSKMDNSFSNYSDDNFTCFDDFKTIVYDIFLRNALISDFNGKFIYNDNILKIGGEEEKILKDISEGSNSTIITKDEKLSDNINGFYHLEDLIQSVDLDSVTDNELIEIFLDSDIIMQDIEQNFYEGGIELDYDNLVLDGKGHTIDASNLSRIFYVTANNITLKNIKFTNGKYHHNHLDNEYCGGAVIKAIHNTSLSIINCEFINNNSRNSAGVIYNDGDSLTIEKSDFKNNNSVNNAGVIYNSKASLTIKDNCLFEKNSAGKFAGVIFNRSKQFIIENNCSFSNNSSKYNGGVIQDLIGNLLISDSVFKNNYSDNEGGVININQESLKEEDDEQLDDNESIFMNSIFQENSANSGGVVIHDGNLLLDSCSFINNNAQYNGGAIYTQIDGCLTLKNTCFSKNNCKFKGGAIYSFNSILKAFKDCNFDSNIADQGGAIFYNGNLLDLNDCSFKMNKALGENGNGCGGAIFKSGNKSDDSIVKYCSFKRDNAFEGGAIYIQNSLSIENTIFQDNYSKVEGDSIFNLGNLNLKNCKFSAETKNTLVNYGQFNQANNEFDDNSDIINKK